MGGMELEDTIASGISEQISQGVEQTSESSMRFLQSVANAIGLNLQNLSLGKMLWSVAVLIVLIIISNILSKIFSNMIKKTKMSESLRKFIVRMIKFMMIFISVMIFADSIGIPITSIVAIFSLFGLAISLSLQNLLGNIMSGISILMLKPFDIGDFIETDISGTVSAIGLFYTELKTIDNKTVFIPNEHIVDCKLTNYTRQDRRRIDIQANAAYDCDIKTVKLALLDAIKSVDTILNEPAPIVGVSKYGDSAVIYDVRAWTETDNYWPSYYALMEAISASYKKHGVSMAYNRLEVDILSDHRQGDKQ